MFFLDNFYGEQLCHFEKFKSFQKLFYIDFLRDF